jgi:hypothetical protein
MSQSYRVSIEDSSTRTGAVNKHIVADTVDYDAQFIRLYQRAQIVLLVPLTKLISLERTD